MAVLVAAAAVWLVLVSGGSGEDPRTPPALPGLPAPFLGTAVVGEGAVTAAVDAYGDVVDLRPSPAGRALIDNPSARQAAGSVATDTGIVPRLRLGGRWLPMWRAGSVSQRYLPGTSVVRTVARFGPQRVVMSAAATGALALTVTLRGGDRAGRVGVAIEPGLRGCTVERRPARVGVVCVASETSARSRSTGQAKPAGAGSSHAGDSGIQAAAVLSTAAGSARGWLARARPLGPVAPAWARRMYARSLLVLHALTDRRTGAVAAGARDGWAYVWPRDAATAALALNAAGYDGEACRVARFLAGLDLTAAARFGAGGAPLPGRGPEGDAAGWVAVAVRAARGPSGTRCPGLPATTRRLPWRNLPDYREGPPGNYLANAIAASAADGPKSPVEADKSARRQSGFDISARRLQGAGVDAAEAWAVRPFPVPGLYAAARRTMLRFAARQTRFGITPGADWSGTEPWSAPTAWTAWSFAALADAERGSPARARADRRQALRLLADLRRIATPAGALPERVGAATGIPHSTTPLAWSHAFAILALRQLWPTAGASAAARSAAPGAARPARR